MGNNKQVHLQPRCPDCGWLLAKGEKHEGHLDKGERFGRHIPVYLRDTPETCWEWRGPRFNSGYGIFYYRGKSLAAHRVAWEMTIGEIPPGKLVLHKCDNRPCVRVSHLFLGDAQDNMTDCKVKRRNATGEKHGKSKLNASLVRSIRASKDSASTLAAKYGVGKTTILHVKRGATWKLV